MDSNYQSQNITELAKVLLNIQQQLLPAAKDSTNTFTQSSYASLKSVTARGHDALQTGVPGFGEGIFRILWDWLKLSLHIEQGLCQFRNL